MSETAAALQAAVQANHFGVMQVHNLKETMAKEGVEFAHECLIFEVCQPQQAKKVLDENMSVSTACHAGSLFTRRAVRPFWQL